MSETRNSLKSADSPDVVTTKQLVGYGMKGHKRTPTSTHAMLFMFSPNYKYEILIEA